MSDQAPNRPEETPSPGADKGKSESQLRLVTAEGNVVFPEDAEPTDDSPTIISKNKPAEPVQAAPNLASLYGRKLAHFELLEPLGVGGMAAVLRARDTQLERVVALKILPPDMAQDEENIRRFHQEARAAAKLDHENIARVFFCGEDQRLHFIAFEYVEGVNLRVLLEERRRLPVAEAVRIILQIATGLEHAASRGVVHRDVKPSNIIISPNGRAKLVDMGLARSLEPHHDGGLTQSGVTLGTFDYISPEQALEPREADSRSDIYSLGCTFYHMLTGQAPVPEGTAAKKLNHHQHVAPIDPRQFNPDIPDEVAAVLSRMMAKDPKERYQRPVHLVQHLMQVARKVGAAEDTPEGVLFLDAPMPGDPRKRPLLLLSLGALALAVLLVLLSLAPQPRGTVVPPQTVNADKPIDREAVVNPGPKPPSQAPVHEKVFIRNEQDLAKFFNEPGVNLSAVLVKSLDLPESGLTFHGDGKRNLILDCEDLDEPKTIHFKVSGKTETPDLVAGLVLDGGTVTFNNIRFEIEVGETPVQTVASLGILGSGTVYFNHCIFSQEKVPQRRFIPQRKNRIPVASIAIENPRGTLEERPRVVLKGCSFTGGQVAIGINGPAQVLPTDCAFKPYGALFHMRGDSQFPVGLNLQRCSALVINGPVFRLDDAATCDLQARNCIFGRPDNAPSEDRDEPDLIRQTDKMEPAVKWDGYRNCYANLNALWVRPKQIGNEIRTEFDEFRNLVREAGGNDIGSARLTKETPIWVSAAPWKEDSLRKAFELRGDVREVRTQDLKKALGFEKCEKVTMAPLPPLAIDDPKVAEYKLKANEKVVDADGADVLPPQHFKYLFQALALAQPKDVIYIKKGKNSNEVLVKPTALDQLGIDVTLRPYPGQEKDGPILKMTDTGDIDAAFFRMLDGTLVIEQLEFLLEADQENMKAMALVFMSGNASCTFRNCIITMRPSDKVKLLKNVPLSVVTLADPEEAMKMPGRSTRPGPELHFHSCLIRGEGEVLTVRASRPLELEVDNSLVALNGSLLGVQSGAKETPQGSAALIKLNHVSVFLGETLLTFRAGKNPRGFVPARMEAQNSLFIGMGDKEFAQADQALVRIEANDVTEDNLRLGYLDWKGDHNAFGNFEKLLHTVRQDGQSFFGMNSSRWSEYYPDTNAKFLSQAAAIAPLAPRSPWNATPEAFVPKEDLQSPGSEQPFFRIPSPG